MTTMLQDKHVWECKTKWWIHGQDQHWLTDTITNTIWNYMNTNTNKLCVGTICECVCDYSTISRESSRGGDGCFRLGGLRIKRAHMLGAKKGTFLSKFWVFKILCIIMLHTLLCKLETICRPNFEELIIVQLGTSWVVFDTILYTQLLYLLHPQISTLWHTFDHGRSRNHV